PAAPGPRDDGSSSWRPYYKSSSRGCKSYSTSPERAEGRTSRIAESPAQPVAACYLLPKGGSHVASPRPVGRRAGPDLVLRFVRFAEDGAQRVRRRAGPG